MQKKLFLLSGITFLAATFTANAGEYMPYVGFDYVNRTLNVSGNYPDNYDIGNINGGIKFVDLGAVELFAERSMREKKTSDSGTARGRLYSWGADVLVNGWNFNDGAILGSVGYGRMSAKIKRSGNMRKDTENALRLGVGGELNPTPDWGVRAMFRYSLADGDVYSNSKEFSLGARYYFY